MRGEFIGVWGETWREIWLPLIGQPFSEDGDALAEDIFSELYRELSRALRKPTDESAVELLLGDAIALRQAFDRAAQLGNPDLSYEAVKEAFDTSGAHDAKALDQRRAILETALLGLLGERGVPSLVALLREHANDAERIDAAWERKVERIINDPRTSRETFETTTANDIAGERALVAFLESTYDVLEGVGGDDLSNRYFNLLNAFIGKFSLRYDIRRPCTLCPTLPGIFASLVRDLRLLTARDAHLDELMKDFEESLRDLRIDCSDRRIKTCIQKQINLLEAVGRAYPKVKRKTLGAISKQIPSWPHDEVRTALQSLYGFTCDYPGIRHGGTRENALRAIDMRDMVAISILLVGFTPYLSTVNADLVYRGD
jgi:hypothetical protein